MNRGEIWWVGTEEGRRPYLILMRQAAIPVLHSLLGVPATRTVRNIPSEVGLDQSDGMPQSCALSLDNLTLVPKEYFIEPICTLSPNRLHEVCSALRIAAGC